MRKLQAALAVLGLAAAAFALSSCGSSGGKEGGTLTASYASFPELDPTISFSVEGWTAMYSTYLPLLTYKHVNGEEGAEVVPALAESLPKITNGGKTYALTLRKGLKYSSGAPVKASDFTASIERVFKLNSYGSSFYTDIVGAEKFAETKSGGIPGIKTDDKTGKITIELVKPRGTFTNELALLYSAVLPAGTPAKNLTDDPPPATGPYEIVNVEPGRGWTYKKNPQWAKSNAVEIPEVPSGHVDKIDVSVVRNQATQVNEIERNKTNWMQTVVPADLYNKVKDRYEGTQFRVEYPINVYFFWLNMSKPPFNDLKVREAVNYAVDPKALEKIYSGTLAVAHQILPKGVPGHEAFDLFPHNMAKAKALIAEAHPSDREITVWTDNESPNDDAGAYYASVLEELGFNVHLKTINGDVYFQLISNPSTANLDTGWADWFADYPHPNDFIEPNFSGNNIGSTNLSHMDVPKLTEKIESLGEEQLGPQQEGEYAALDREIMAQAPWVPYGTITVSTFVSREVDLNEVVFNLLLGQDLTSFQLK